MAIAFDHGRGRVGARLMASVLAFAACSDAAAHGFGQRYDLPLPLWLWVIGAGATIVLSFVVMALFLRPEGLPHDYRRVNLLTCAPTRWLAHPLLLAMLRLTSVVTFVATLTAGFIGTSDPFRNLAPTMVWVIWWVGLAFVCALVGDLWALVNPLRTLFAWTEALYAKATGGRHLTLDRLYPRALGVWPAVAVLVVFTWAELVWTGGDVPFNLAAGIAGYAVFSWAGMFVFGREVWLQNAEAFSVAFGVLARFAPLEVRVIDEPTVNTCPGLTCRRDRSSCVNGYVCLGRTGRNQMEWNLRPPAVGLLNDRVVMVSLMIFVLTMLSTVTFDGFLETQTWQDILNGILSAPVLSPLISIIRDIDLDEVQVVTSAALVAFPLIFLAVFASCSWLMVRVTALSSRSSVNSDGYRTIGLACAFVLTLVPIAIAYHLAHYLGMLLTTGQFVIALISDPFGFGWDLWGTADFKANIGFVGARFVWYAAVSAIVLGHVFAVYLAHVVAIRLFSDAHTALVSQIPMVALMVLYTMVSLWILAQPIVA